MNMKKGITGELPLDAPLYEDVRRVTGSWDAGSFAFGVVVSRFNTELTDALLRAAVTCLKEHGAAPARITVVRVPGAFEIPTALELMAAGGQHDALIALGAVIQGETPHAGLITAEVNRALCDIARRYRLPVIDGVVITHTMEQAVARCTTGEQSRGWYAAKAAIEMAHVTSQLKA